MSTTLYADSLTIVDEPNWPLSLPIKCQTLLASSWSHDIRVATRGYIPRMRSYRGHIAKCYPKTRVQWLRQVHGNKVVDAASTHHFPEADGSYSCHPGYACSVLTADCLPLVLVSSEPRWVAVLHAGWRGIYADIISEAIKQYPGEHGNLWAWIGPHICPTCYQVNDDFQRNFTRKCAAYQSFFTSHGDCIHADLAGILSHQLRLAGIPATQCLHTSVCTSCESGLPSYRRDAYRCGRLLTLAFLQ